jgi:hypothetical protein
VDASEKRKICYSFLKSSSLQPVAIPTKLSRLLGEWAFFLFPFWLPLEHGASTKLPVSLQFLYLGLLGRVISSSQDLYIHRTTQT